MRRIVGVCVVGLLAAAFNGCSNPLSKPKPLNNGCLADRLGSYPLPGSPEVQTGTPEVPSFNIPRNMPPNGANGAGGGMPSASSGFNDPNMYPK